MRNVVVSSIVSLDGYVAGPGGNVMSLPMDAFFDEHNLHRQRRADTLLLGRTTYLGLKGYWPAVAEDPICSPAVQLDASTAEVHRETAQRNNALRKVVVSDTLTQADTEPWTETTTIVPRADAHETVHQLKEQSGDDLLIFGSRTLWAGLLKAGLVDELHLLVGPVVLGGGLPAYGSGPVPPLSLLDVRRREGSDNACSATSCTTGDAMHGPRKMPRWRGVMPIRLLGLCGPCAGPAPPGWSVVARLRTCLHAVPRGRARKTRPERCHQHRPPTQLMLRQNPDQGTLP